MRVTIWEKQYGSTYKPHEYESDNEAVQDIVDGLFGLGFLITRPLKLAIVHAVEDCGYCFETPEVPAPKPIRLGDLDIGTTEPREPVSVKPEMAL